MANNQEQADHGVAMPRITAATLNDAAGAYVGNKWMLWRLYKIAKRRSYSNSLSCATKANYRAASARLFDAFSHAARSAQ